MTTTTLLDTIWTTRHRTIPCIVEYWIVESTAVLDDGSPPDCRLVLGVLQYAVERTENWSTTAFGYCTVVRSLSTTVQLY
jgi:hypothetical protein